MSWVFALLAAGSAIVGIAMLAHLPDWAANDRAFYARVKAIAAYNDREGRLPPQNDPEGHLPPKYVEAGPYGPKVWIEHKGGCDPRVTEVASFREAISDRYSLSFLEGDFWQCIAIPSGKTTLPLSVKGYLLSATGIEILEFGVFSACCACVAFAAWPARGERRLNTTQKLLLICALLIFAVVIEPGFDNTDGEYVKTPAYLKRYVIVMHNIIPPTLSLVVLHAVACSSCVN